MLVSPKRMLRLLHFADLDSQFSTQIDNETLCYKKNFLQSNWHYNIRQFSLQAVVTASGDILDWLQFHGSEQRKRLIIVYDLVHIICLLKVPGPISQNGNIQSNDVSSPNKSWFQISIK